jgi:hypothetical protein
MKVSQEQIREEIKSGQAEMRFSVSAIEEMIDAWIADMNHRKETTACQDAMEANLEKMGPTPG